MRVRPAGRGAKVQEEGVSGVSWLVGDKGVVSSWARRVGDGVGWDMAGWVMVKSLVGVEEKWMMSVSVRLGRVLLSEGCLQCYMSVVQRRFVGSSQSTCFGLGLG